jgi:hypothetical protein
VVQAVGGSSPLAHLRELPAKRHFSGSEGIRADGECPSIFGARAVDGLPRPRKCGVFVVQDRVHKRATGSKRGPIFFGTCPGAALDRRGAGVVRRARGQARRRSGSGVGAAGVTPCSWPRARVAKPRQRTRGSSDIGRGGCAESGRRGPGPRPSRFSCRSSRSSPACH